MLGIFDKLTDKSGSLYVYVLFQIHKEKTDSKSLSVYPLSARSAGYVREGRDWKGVAVHRSRSRMGHHDATVPVAFRQSWAQSACKQPRNKSHPLSCSLCCFIILTRTCHLFPSIRFFQQSSFVAQSQPKILNKTYLRTRRSRSVSPVAKSLPLS